MKYQWSIDGQTPEFLAATRMALLDDRTIRTIVDEVPLTKGMRVLDVGCGSGELCFRLGSRVSDVTFIGVDNDAGFIDFSNKRSKGAVGYPFERPNPRNSYHFVHGDGLALPFEADSFDAVISHTYLTAVPDWERALLEMIRVCKKGHFIASITSMTDDFFGSGSMWLFGCAMEERDADLVDKVTRSRIQAFGSMDITAGISPRAIPAAFSNACLDDVFCIPLGHYFCLSDGKLPREQHLRYVELLKAVEDRELMRSLNDADARALLSDAEWSHYADLIELRYRQLMNSRTCNVEWNWYGSCSLLVAGRKPGPLYS